MYFDPKCEEVNLSV